MSLRSLLVGIAALVAVGGAQAQDKYPSHDIDFIIGYAAGGGNDLITRAIIPPMEKLAGVKIIPSNIPGASGATGAKKIASMEPGYGLGLYSSTLISIQYTGLSDINIKNFTPVAEIVEDTAVVLVPTDSPIKTLKDLVDQAKAKPGSFKMANSGTGGIWHLAAALIEKQTGAKFEHVPYKGGRPALVATAGHEVQATITNIAEAASLVDNKSLRILCALTDERVSSNPDVPTAKEQGVTFAFPVWRGIFTAAGGSKERIEKLAGFIKEAIKDPKFVEFVKNSGLEIKYKGPEEFGKLIASEDKTYAELLQDLGLKVSQPK
jgi:tripartite-type tricarboxylate transporter receptor subunit TctC